MAVCLGIPHSSDESAALFRQGISSFDASRGDIASWVCVSLVSFFAS